MALTQSTPLNPPQPNLNMNPNLTPASLYVGDLQSDVTEALLFEVFNSIGPVASIRVCRDVISRRSLKYAYVNFHSSTDAERALDTMNYTNIRGRPCRLMWSQRDPSIRKSGRGNIFVKNLDKSIDHKTLFDTFSMFGNILSCKVAMDEKACSLGYGFVHYETDEAAKRAIEKVNGMVIASREVYVAPFLPRNERESKSSFTNVYVKNMELEESGLEEVFGRFGKVTSVCVAREDGGKPRGFGFVNYERSEDAKKAIDGLHEKQPLNLYCARAQNKYERSKELRVRFEKMRLETAEKYAGVNLYIKNLDDSVDDDRLNTEFTPFGTVTSAKVMKDANGRSKGFGFVCYSLPEDATKALSEMNGKLLCGKPLYVAMAQPREIRRQQLQAQSSRPKPIQQFQPMYPPGTPMYYPQPSAMPRGAGMFYQQMMPRGWAGRQVQQQAQQMIPNMYMMQQPQQQQQMGPRSIPGQHRNPPGMRGRGMQGKNPRHMNQGPNQSNTRIKFNTGMTPGSNTGVNSAGGHAPFATQALVHLPEPDRKHMIGEKIFPMVAEMEPSNAGKITGMLLEMDIDELLLLIENRGALKEKVKEARDLIVKTST